VVEIQRIADRNHQAGLGFDEGDDPEALRHLARHMAITSSLTDSAVKSTKSMAACAASARVTSSCATTPAGSTLPLLFLRPAARSGRAPVGIS